MADKYYIAAPWIQEDRGDGLCWYPQPNTVGSFDMRGIEQPLGFFCVSELPSSGSDFVLLGKGDIRGYIEVSISIRAFWREFLGLTIEEMPDSISQLSEMLIKTVYYHGDPEGAKRFYPPTITSKGNLEIFLSSHTRPGATFDKNMLHRRKFTGKDDPAWPVIQRHYQNIYQKWIDENELARFKVLSTWERELSVPVKDLQPFGINEKAIKPETIITDDFARGNQDLEDSADWDQVDGSYIVVSEEIQVDGSYTSLYPASYRNTNALSSINHYAQIKQVNQPSINGGNDLGHWGPAIRFGADETFYFAKVAEKNTDADVYKTISGTTTAIDLNTWAPSWSNIVYSQIDGTTIKLFIDGAEKSSFSDPSIGGGLRCGIIGHWLTPMGTASCDDFEAGDLAAGGINYDVSLTLSASFGISQSGRSNALASLTIANHLGISNNAIATALGSLTLSQNLGISQSALAATLASITYSSNYSISQSASVSALAALTVSFVSAFSSTGKVDALASLVLNTQSGISSSIAIDRKASLTLAAEFGISSNAQAETKAGLTLSQLAGIAAIGKVVALAGLTLSNILSIEQTATMTIGRVITPDERLFTITIESRHFTVEEEDRYFLVPEEDRHFEN